MNLRSFGFAVVLVVGTSNLALSADEVDPEFAASYCTMRAPSKLSGEAKSKWVSKCAKDMTRAATPAEIHAARARDLAESRKHGVLIGYTQQQVLDSSWGKPNHVNRTITATHVTEQWVYSGGYLYFTDGVLTAIQN